MLLLYHANLTQAIKCMQGYHIFAIFDPVPTISCVLGLKILKRTFLILVRIVGKCASRHLYHKEDLSIHCSFANNIN